MIIDLVVLNDVMNNLCLGLLILCEVTTFLSLLKVTLSDILVIDRDADQTLKFSL